MKKMREHNNGGLEDDFSFSKGVIFRFHNLLLIFRGGICLLIASTNGKLVVWGPVVSNRVARFRNDPFSQGDPRNPNHRAPNHQFKIATQYPSIS